MSELSPHAMEAAAAAAAAASPPLLPQALTFSPSPPGAAGPAGAAGALPPPPPSSLTQRGQRAHAASASLGGGAGSAFRAGSSYGGGAGPSAPPSLPSLRLPLPPAPARGILKSNYSTTPSGADATPCSAPTPSSATGAASAPVAILSPPPPPHAISLHGCREALTDCAEALSALMEAAEATLLRGGAAAGGAAGLEQTDALQRALAAAGSCAARAREEAQRLAVRTPDGEEGTAHFGAAGSGKRAVAGGAEGGRPRVQFAPQLCSFREIA